MQNLTSKLGVAVAVMLPAASLRGLIFFCCLALMTACSRGQSDNPQRAIASVVATSAAVSTSTETPITSAESAIAPEVNPPGDIPDTQAFVSYHSVAGGYRLDVPEGWARSENGASVSFVERFDGVMVGLAPVLAAPTVASARANEAARIVASGHAATITGVSAATLPSGSAIIIRYTSNSDPNAVTNNRVRLENEAVLLFHNGKEAILTMWAPQGADNVDQWNRMSNSFRWM